MKTLSERKTIQDNNIMNEATLQMALILQGAMKEDAGKPKQQRKRDESERHGSQQLKRRPEPEKSSGGRISPRHDILKESITQIGMSTDQIQADHSCVLAIDRQRRKRQFSQISEHPEERVERTKNKVITSHGCRRNIS